MESSIKLGSIRGIEIGINHTWLIVFALMTASLAMSFFPQAVPGLGSINYWVLGALASVLLFASVLVHELSHSIVAQQLGMRVSSITLFIFGGVSNIQGEPNSPRDEALMAAAGPLSSIVIGVVLLGIIPLVQAADAQVTSLVRYLYAINLLLAAFNLIPGFPLDGGRVARAIIWGVTGSLERATRIASRLGQAVAYLFILIGIFSVFNGNMVGGIWFAFIGWFLNNAAEQSYQQVTVKSRLRGIYVSQVMDDSPATVSPEAQLEDLVDDYVLRRSVRAVPVVENGNLIGIVTLSDVREVPRERWDVTPVRQVMSGLEKLKTVEPQDELNKALQLLAEHDLNQLPVVQGRILVGLLTRGQVINFLQLRRELGVEAGAFGEGIEYEKGGV